MLCNYTSQHRHSTFFQKQEENRRMRFTISHLTVEYLEHPMGIETQTPKFGWWLDAAENGLLQAAYQIVVTKDEKVVWNSQKVFSDKVFQIPYEG